MFEAEKKKPLEIQTVKMLASSENQRIKSLKLRTSVDMFVLAKDGSPCPPEPSRGDIGTDGEILSWNIEE